MLQNCHRKPTIKFKNRPEPKITLIEPKGSKMSQNVNNTDSKNILQSNIPQTRPRIAPRVSKMKWQIKKSTQWFKSRQKNAINQILHLTTFTATNHSNQSKNHSSVQKSSSHRKKPNIPFKKLFSQKTDSMIQKSSEKREKPNITFKTSL